MHLLPIFITKSDTHLPSVADTLMPSSVMAPLVTTESKNIKRSNNFIFTG